LRAGDIAHRSCHNLGLGQTKGLMISLEEACARILADIGSPDTEIVKLVEAVGRIAGEAVASRNQLPAFDQSAMDGYAVRSQDCASAAPDCPRELALQGRIEAGDVGQETLLEGQCVRLFTGAALPTGADAVIMQEDTAVNAGEPSQVSILHTPKPWENVRLRGEDVQRDTAILAAGQRIGLPHLPLLASQGLAALSVFRAPRIGLLATGNELREPGTPLEPGQIYETNRLMLSCLVRRAGALPKQYPLVRDDLESTRAALQRAMEECDAVVSSGGVSVGDMDFVKPALKELGGEVGLWKVSMKPGKPFLYGRVRGKALYGLPGNPVSALVTFVGLVWPALWRMQGMASNPWPTRTGVLLEPVSNGGDRRHFMRVSMDPNGRVRLSGLQASHALGSLAQSNGLIDVAPRTEWAAGKNVEVLLLDD